MYTRVHVKSSESMAFVRDLTRGVPFLLTRWEETMKSSNVTGARFTYRFSGCNNPVSLG